MIVAIIQKQMSKVIIENDSFTEFAIQAIGKEINRLDRYGLRAYHGDHCKQMG